MMKLIDLYIQEVTRRLPEELREDIALELRSTIEDMLPEEPSEEDVKVILSQLGNPAILANGYLDRPMHLIGPKYFDVYTSLLKIIIPITLTISLITLIGKTIVTSTGEEALYSIIFSIVSKGIWQLLITGMQTAFWITLIFAIIERTDKVRDNIPLTMNFKKWTPDDLKNISYIPKKKAITKIHVFGSFLWTAIWASVYFNASSLFGIYESQSDGFKFISSAFNQEVLFSYWPLVTLVIVLEVAFAIYKGFARQWTKKVAVVNALLQTTILVAFIVIISNNELWNATFLTYINETAQYTEQVKNWAYQSIIVTFVIFTVIDIIEGFRKSRITKKYF
ncbi:hypothetical protein E2636_17755 [Paenisporosarcina antarctica]|uniref:Uncharacterized protein n=2 Tax=Paenisporosarcina antarctica TaxID=417367 RepID=A0A4P7A1R7_9BACL|nr:hypothetical protein E2636_17755 [Paenisporosarcina antarctica]